MFLLLLLLSSKLLLKKVIINFIKIFKLKFLIFINYNLQNKNSLIFKNKIYKKIII